MAPLTSYGLCNISKLLPSDISTIFERPWKLHFCAEGFKRDLLDITALILMEENGVTDVISGYHIIYELAIRTNCFSTGREINVSMFPLEHKHQITH